MSDLLARAAGQFADHPFLISGDAAVTFAEAEIAVRQRALQLRPQEALPVRPKIDISSVIEILAILRARSQAVLVPPSWPADLAQRRLQIAGKALAETIVFTSGTSGTPKPVRLDESNWTAAASGSAEFYRFGPGRCWLLVLPLHHVGGLSIIFRALWSGGAALLAPRPEPGLLVQSDFASLVPTQLAQLLEMRPDPVRCQVLIGGASLSADLVERAQGWTLHRTYGMTETAAVIASGPPDSSWMTVLPAVEIGATGEGVLRVRGLQVSRGYAGDAERTPGDWFVTSDKGRVEGDRVIVTGRSDRIINSGGEKIDPTEIEGVLSRVVGVEEAAAFGLPDERWGQTVAVVFVGSATPEEVVDAISKKLGPIARPRRVIRVDSLPRNELEKIDYPAAAGLFS